MPTPTSAERALPWLLRALWIAVLVSGGRAADSATVGSDAATLLAWLGLAGWVVGVGCMAIPAVVSLTATRAIVPVAVPLAALSWIGGADTVDGVVFAGTASLAAIAAGSSPIGRVFVQASAYGDEDRHLLRPPLPFAIVAVGMWLIWAGVVTAAVATTAQGRTIASLVLWLVGVAGGALLLPRWHRLSRRWLVFVPAGVVVHDHVALAETLMVRRRIVTAIGLALEGTDAADLTGGTPGHAIEIRTGESVTALLGAAAGERAGTAIHLTAFLVAPTRPGRTLAAASNRRLPVGAVT